VDGAAGDHKDGKGHEGEAREKVMAGARVQIDVPEADDAKTRRKGTDQAPGEKASVRGVSNGIEQAGGKICARAEMTIEKHVANEKQERTGEAAKTRNPAIPISDWLDHESHL